MWSYFDTLWNKLLKLKSCCFDDNIGFDFEAIRKIPYVEIILKLYMLKKKIKDLL